MATKEEQEKQQAEAAQREKSQQQGDFLSSLGGIMKFGIWGAIFVGIAYMVLRFFPDSQKLLGFLPIEARLWLNKTLGDEFFGDAVAEFLALEPEKLSEKLANHLELEKPLADEAATLLKENAELIIKTAKEANGGTLNMETMLNMATIQRLATTHPELISKVSPQLKDALFKKFGASAGKEAGEFVADKAKLDAALQSPLRDDLIQQMASAIPNTTMSKEALNFVTKVGLDAEGKSTPAFHALLTGLTQKDVKPDAMIRQLLDFVKTPEAIAHDKETLDLIASLQTQDPNLKMIADAAKNRKNGQALLNFARATSAEQVLSLQATLGTSKPIATLVPMIANDKPLRDALTNFAKESELSQYGPDMRDALTTLLALDDRALAAASRLVKNDVPLDAMKTVTFKGGKISTMAVVDQLLDDATMNRLNANPNFKRPLQDVGIVLGAVMKNEGDQKLVRDFLTTTRDDRNGTLGSYVNLAAITDFMRNVDESKNQEKNAKNNDARTARVVAGFLGGFAHDKEALNSKEYGALTVNDFMGFMSEPSNRQALSILFNNLDMRMMPKEVQDIVNELKNRPGIFELATTKEVAGPMVAALNAMAENKPSGKPIEIPMLANVFGPKEVKEHYNDLVALVNVLNNARTTQTQRG